MKAFKLVLIAVVMALPAVAQNRDGKPKGGKENFEKWLKEVREFKHKFMVKELGLKDNQKEEFFKIMDRMEDECGEVNRNAREMEHEIREKGDKATETDYEKASQILFEQKQKEAAIEMNAYKEFKKVLTPEQLFKLKNADWKFSRGLMDKHKRLKAGEEPHHKLPRQEEKK